MNSLYSISYTIGNDPQQRILFAEMNDRQIREKRDNVNPHESLLRLFKQRIYKKIHVCSTISDYNTDYGNCMSCRQNIIYSPDWDSINICSVSKLA